MKFKDIKQQGFFKHKGTTLCKFGNVGLGYDHTGSVARPFKDDDEVTETNPFK